MFLKGCLSTLRLWLKTETWIKKCKGWFKQILLRVSERTSEGMDLMTFKDSSGLFKTIDWVFEEEKAPKKFAHMKNSIS